MSNQLTELKEGSQIPYGGNKFATVPQSLADAFKAGDSLVVVQETGALLHLTAADSHAADEAVSAAYSAFGELGSISDDQITEFYLAFAAALADEKTFGHIKAANDQDIERAKEQGRSTTRLELTETMRSDMIAGLKGWASYPSSRNQIMEKIDHEGWSIEQVRSGLGVVGFVFEGRPNVFADATGVLRSGNTVVFRIGSDALGTARAIVQYCLTPALAASGLPDGAVTLVNSRSRGAGLALFSDSRLSLAVARGSGFAVSQLGAVARQAGISVSLHGTGGAWMVVDESVDLNRFSMVVEHSLDRKVCNTLNTVCLTRSVAEVAFPVLLQALKAASSKRSSNPKLHFTEAASDLVPQEWLEDTEISRAEGLVKEPGASIIEVSGLGVEWEWEESPEVSVHVVDDVADAVVLFNTYSPRFVASLIAEDRKAQDEFFANVDAPFVGDGFTRWVDGQYALQRPELGLSNWDFGRLFARGGVLAGDSVFTVRARVAQQDPQVHR